MLVQKAYRRTDCIPPDFNAFQRPVKVVIESLAEGQSRFYDQLARIAGGIVGHDFSAYRSQVMANPPFGAEEKRAGQWLFPAKILRFEVAGFTPTDVGELVVGFGQIKTEGNLRCQEGNIKPASSGQCSEAMFVRTNRQKQQGR